MMLSRALKGKGHSLISLSNGDFLQIIQHVRTDLYDVFHIDDTNKFNRRYWYDVDALTAQCILNALLEDPLMQLSNHPER